MSLVSSKQKYGGCGEPWNLEGIEEKLLILNDKLLDNKCQLFADISGPHKENLYGDVNLVSGIPFPKIPLEPKWYRLRFLNAAVSRPFLVKIKDDKLKDISANICKVIGADGGYRDTPAQFPAGGLLLGVAERYEVVCDFTNYKGKSLIMWNDYDEKMMKAVPYFCNSHLIASLQVLAVMMESKIKASQLSKIFTKTDNLEENLPLKNLSFNESLIAPAIDNIIKQFANAKLNIVVRKSGTENVLRFFVDGNLPKKDLEFIMLELKNRILGI
jgi:FtsP/CotA-like multicopper oxidase with cupredoxin domain